MAFTSSLARSVMPFQNIESNNANKQYKEDKLFTYLKQCKKDTHKNSNFTITKKSQHNLKNHLNTINSETVHIAKQACKEVIEYRQIFYHYQA